jgi:hypothetical protein
MKLGLAVAAAVLGPAVERLQAPVHMSQVPALTAADQLAAVCTTDDARLDHRSEALAPRSMRAAVGVSGRERGSAQLARGSELLERRAVVAFDFMASLDSLDVVPNLASSDLVEDGAVNDLDPTRRFKLLARDRLGRLIIASRRALSRTALDQPGMGRDAQSPVLVHPAALSEWRAVRDFDVASGVVRARVRALDALKEARCTPLDSRVGRNRLLIGRSPFGARAASPTTASKQKSEKSTSQPSSHGQISLATDYRPRQPKGGMFRPSRAKVRQSIRGENSASQAFRSKVRRTRPEAARASKEREK